MTLDEICDNVRQLADRHGWDQTDSAARMLHVTAEVGEVADALISLRAASSDQAEAARTALGHEIFDAIWNLSHSPTPPGSTLHKLAAPRWR